MNDANYFRNAKHKDLPEINALIRASKAHWGYSEEFMENFMNLFSVTPEYLSRHATKVLIFNDEISGLFAFEIHEDDSLELDYFFIHPSFIGKGLGRLLWNEACSTASTLSDKGFTLWSDPEAEAFYEKMGCKKTGEKKSPLLPNRKCPVMEYLF